MGSSWRRRMGLPCRLTTEAERELVEVEARLARLADEAGEPSDAGRLRALAARRRALDRLLTARDALADSARSAGDGLDLATLRGEARGLDLDFVRAEAADVAARLEAVDARVEAAIREQVRAEAALRDGERDDAAGAVARREAAVADLHEAAGRYVELKVARELLAAGVRVVREESQAPLVRDAGALFARMTLGEFEGVAADVDDRGVPVVVGIRSDGSGPRSVAAMSDGARDQMFLAFRLASLAAYCAAAEPLPFVGDDLLVHFDDDRAEATLDLLAGFGERTQVLLFTHHRSVRDVAARLEREGRATVVDVAP